MTTKLKGGKVVSTENDDLFCLYDLSRGCFNGSLLGAGNKWRWEPPGVLPSVVVFYRHRKGADGGFEYSCSQKLGEVVRLFFHKMPISGIVDIMMAEERAQLRQEAQDLLETSKQLLAEARRLIDRSRQIHEDIKQVQLPPAN